MDEYKKGGGYGKRPVWQWILIYVVIGGIIYGLIYYFIFARRGGYNSSGNQYVAPSQNSSYSTPSPTINSTPLPAATNPPTQQAPVQQNPPTTNYKY